MSKIPLYGFNNLTKNLSFSLYKLHYLHNEQAYLDYKTYINECFCADSLSTLLVNICRAIGGNVLNIAKQDYQPQGASITLMISEEAQPESLVAHLDKSHLCIHTYPEETPQEGFVIFRADIELSTCGVISPLKVLNYVIEEFDADVVDIDYRIRGMTRDGHGGKLFIDDELDHISDYLNPKLISDFHITNHKLATQNLFHSKLCRKAINLEQYLFKAELNDLSAQEQVTVMKQLERELHELYTNGSTIEI